MPLFRRVAAVRQAAPARPEERTGDVTDRVGDQDATIDETFGSGFRDAAHDRWAAVVVLIERVREVVRRVGALVGRAVGGVVCRGGARMAAVFGGYAFLFGFLRF